MYEADEVELRQAVPEMTALTPDGTEADPAVSGQGRQQNRPRRRSSRRRLTRQRLVRGVFRVRHSGRSLRDRATGLSDFRRGAVSAMRLALTPLGRRAARSHLKCPPASHAEHGLVVILPGIDGCTTVCDGVVRGLILGGLQAVIKVVDWRSFRVWSPIHLATHQRNQRRAKEIADSIRAFQHEYPGKPVHLIGHSAGAGMALFVMQHLTGVANVQSVVLLAAAVSRQFDVERLVPSATNGIWNFWSRGDLPATGLGTMIFGTMDRRHSAAAGSLGFKLPIDSDGHAAGSRLHQVGYRYRMARVWNFGGHFGCTNTAFVARYVAPIVLNRVTTVNQLFGRAGM
jgi:pimeloyl-ACP methyl ester carboxylesterase